MNPSYAAFANSRFINCFLEKAMITDEMAEDIAQLEREFKDEQLEPLVESPSFLFPGTQGFTADAADANNLGWAAQSRMGCACLRKYRSWSMDGDDAGSVSQKHPLHQHAGTPR